MHDLWVGSKNSALCVTTLDPTSCPVQTTHLGTKSKFIIITHYAAICKSSLPSVVPNNQKSLQAGNAHSLMVCCVQMGKYKDMHNAAVLIQAT